MLLLWSKFPPQTLLCVLQENVLAVCVLKDIETSRAMGASVKTEEFIDSAKTGKVTYIYTQHSHTRFSNILERQLCLETVTMSEVVEKPGVFVTMLKGTDTIMHSTVCNNVLL